MRSLILSLLPLAAAGTVALTTLGLLSPTGGSGSAVASTVANTSALTAAVRSAGASGPAWVSYTIAAETHERFVCCTGLNGNQRPCRPEHDTNHWSLSSDPAQPGLERDRLRILLAVNRGQVQQVHAYSLGCEVELSWPLVELGRVNPEDSVELLRHLALHPPTVARERGDHIVDQALSAIGLHATTSAIAALTELAGAERPTELRRSAIFWLGQRQSETAVSVLSSFLDREPSADLREHLVFSLSQTGLTSAINHIHRTAQHDVSPQVRQQGWFWLAQSGAPNAATWIRAALESDRDPEVREQAVFALSQLPDDQATDELLRVLRETRDAKIQRQALFWLAQSDDPRALERIAKILE